LRQQRGARLHHAFLLRVALRFGGGELRVAAARHVIGLHQVGGGGLAGNAGEDEGEGEGTEAESHADSSSY